MSLSIMLFNIATLSITLNIMKLSKMSLSIMSFNITTLSLEILNIRHYIMTLGITKNKTLSIMTICITVIHPK